MPFDTEVGLGPGHILLDGDPTSSLPKKGTDTEAPTFGPMSSVAKWLPTSATAELLLL